MLNHVNQLLFKLLGSNDLVNRWWSTPNKAFGMQPPSVVDLPKVLKYLQKF